jgi:hypothetical protein
VRSPIQIVSGQSVDTREMNKPRAVPLATNLARCLLLQPSLGILAKSGPEAPLASEPYGAFADVARLSVVALALASRQIFSISIFYCVPSR